MKITNPNNQQKMYSTIRSLTDSTFHRFNWYLNGKEIVGVCGGFDSAKSVFVIEWIRGEKKQTKIDVTPITKIKNFH